MPLPLGNSVVSRIGEITYISEIGPEYGYFPNAGKTWLIVKETDFEKAKRVFKDTGLTISKEGKRHLGSAESYVEEKVSKWKEELERLSEIAITQPQAAYAAYTHDFKSKWTYLAWTTLCFYIETLLAPLEELSH